MESQSSKLKEHKDQIVNLQSEVAKIKSAASLRASSMPTQSQRPDMDREAFLGGFPNMDSEVILQRATSVLGSPPGLVK
eukprot:12403749-Karenia_brevis.AAC.1